MNNILIQEGILAAQWDMVFLLDHTGKVVMANVNAKQFFNHQNGSIEKQNFQSFFPAPFCDQVEEHINNPRLKDFPKPGENKIYGVTGEGIKFPCQLRIRDIQTDGTRYFICLIRDLSEEKKNVTFLVDSLNEANKAKAEANEANQVKSRFLANMSHEIRTPLNGIMGFTEMMEETELTEEQHTHLRTIHTCGETLLSLINDILDISKIEADKMTLELIPFNLEELIYEVNDIVKTKIQSKDVDLLVEIGDIYSTVLGDSVRLKQIILNLMGNAVKFTESGEIITRVTVLNETDDEIKLKIEISDSGIGIKPAELEKIFDAFSQADTTTTRNFGGTGLGLAISKNLLSLMGTELKVESESGKGSQFYFEINFKKGKVLDDRRNLAMKEANVLGKKCLIVDDNETSCNILHSLVDKLDYQSHIVHRVDDAHKYLETNQVDIILLDIMIPDKDGFQFLDEFKNHKDYAATKIVVISADFRIDTIQKIKSYNCDGFIFKPVRRAEFFEMLSRIFIEKSEEKKEMLFENTRLSNAYSVPQHILIAEDNITNQKLMRAMLTRMGQVITCVDNGEQAVEAARKQDFDLILMDVQMPVMNGLDATKKIRKLGLKLPVIALTASAEVENRKNCLEAGMTDFLAKPVSRNSVRSMINTHGKKGDPVIDSLRKKFLIVEDEKTLANILNKRVLAYFPHCESRMVHNGMEALVLIGSYLPDILFLDMNLPGTDGLGVLEFLKKNERYRHIKVIVMTALPRSSKKVQQAFRMGVHDVIQKPFQFEHVQNIIKSCFDYSMTSV